MNIPKWIKDYWVSILLVIFGGILEFLTFSNTGVPLWVIGIIIIIVGILQFLDKRASDQQFTSVVTDAATSINKLNQKVGNLSKQLC